MQEVLTSKLVKQQLPSFVRDDYPIFVTFLEKYYEWLETNNQVSYELDALQKSVDIDTADEYYIEQIRKDLTPYFPTEIAGNKTLFLKLIHEFYKTSGTPDSVKFLFKALYNEDIDIYYPKEDILKTSDGKWVLPLALRIDTDDDNIYNIEKCILTGQTSKSTALVERVVRSVDRQLGIVYIEVYVSNVQRLFQTGETVTAIYNDGISDITVSGRLIGALSEITVDPQNRGLYYNSYDPAIGYAGDPVTIVGGLNPNSNTPIGAIAYVGETTKGGVTDIIVVDGGFGFRSPTENANSSIFRFIGGFDNAPLGTEATAKIDLLDKTEYRVINVSSTLIESIYTDTIASINSNTILQVTDVQTLNLYSIASAALIGQGGGYRVKPTTDVYSLYMEDEEDVLVMSSANILKDTDYIASSTVDLTLSFEVGDLAKIVLPNRFEATRLVTAVTSNRVTFSQSFSNDITGILLYKILRRDLKNLGSLGRIAINKPGEDYNVGEYLIFTGGTGYGANAKITEVHANNGIKKIEFQDTGDYIIGGEGYTRDSLPTITINTVSGANAELSIREVNGDGESFDLSTSRIGAISKLRIYSYGYDYTDTPIISLRNADLTVSNVTTGQLFVSNTLIYQGTSNTNTTFSAKVDSYVASTGFLRIFDYKGTLDKNKLLISDDGVTSANVVSEVYYGDGKAKANAKFENGLIRYPGIYLNTDGQISADKRLQDGEKYHNFSYVIKTKTDYSRFKKPLEDIVHPIGTKTFVTKIDDNEEMVPYTNQLDTITFDTHDVTFNVSYGAKSIISTNSSVNLANTINVGDTIVLSGLVRRLQNTVNVVSGSNAIFGHANSVNFINDLQEGDVIYLSTGNTVTVTQVANSNYAYVSSNINVTSTSATINVVFDETIIANTVNANTITTKTTILGNGTFLTANIGKVR